MFSPRTKTVDSKFILKPIQYSQRNTPRLFQPAFDKAVDSKPIPSMLMTPHCSWSPITSEAPLDLIPITKDVPTVDLETVANSPVPSPRQDTNLDESSAPQIEVSNVSELDLSSNYSQNADDEITSSESSESSPRPLDEDNYLNDDENLDQSRKPRKGDQISYFDATTNSWIRAQITHDLSRRYPNYFNIVTTDRKRLGLYLTPDTRWTLHIDHPTPEENRTYCDHISSMDPSSNSLPILDIRHLSSSSSVDNLSLNSPNASDALDSQSLRSLEWDYATQCDSPSYFNDIPLDRVVNLDNVLPGNQNFLTRSMSIDLLQVHNLDHQLPLTSTPSAPRSRLSNLRRSLPLERVRGGFNLPTFLSKLNVFSRKN